jgi:hypothetical protein
MSDEIDLGTDHEEGYGLSLPSMGGGGKRYPSFHYSGPTELDLPESGEMKIKFVKTRETHSKHPDGKAWYECDLEVRCICDVESEEDEVAEPTHRDRSAEEALDAIAEALNGRKESDE